MNKPESLRKHLLSSISSLAQNPDSLIIYIDGGKLNTRLKTNLNFNYQYKLILIVTDYGLHPNTLIVPLLAWLKHHQIDLADEAISYDAEIISHDKIDLEISFELNEAVLVNEDSNGEFSVQHLSEPVPDYNRTTPDPFEELFPISKNHG